MSIRQLRRETDTIGTEVALIPGKEEEKMSNFTIDIEKQLSKLGKDIQQFVEKISPAETETGDFKPDCDIAESDRHYAIWVDLPGLDKDQVNISFRNQVITISGDRELYLEDDEVLKRSERRQGSFTRSFALPANVDTSSITARFSNGVLSVKISKIGSDEEGSQSIPIQ